MFPSTCSIAITAGLLAASLTLGRLELVPDLTIGDREDAAIGVVLEVVEDSRGRLYCADSGFGTIQVFDAEGNFLEQLAEPGEGPGKLMIPFVMAIDGKDRLYIAGVGGRVAVWDTDGNHIGEYRRRNPSGTVRSIAVAPNGDVILAAYDAGSNTFADVYGADEQFRFSIRSPRDAIERENVDDPEAAQFFGGGSIDVEPDGSILYTQQFPFLIQRFSAEGELLGETTAGGSDWLPSPPAPERHQRTFSLQLPGRSIDIRRVGDHVLNTAIRHVDGARQTLLTLYDANLDLVATTELDGVHSVVGVDRQNRVLIFDRNGEVPMVTRARVRAREGGE